MPLHTKAPWSIDPVDLNLITAEMVDIVKARDAIVKAKG